jgi:hypothetical protein
VQKDACYRPAAVHCHEDPAAAAFFGANKEANLENTDFEEIHWMLVHAPQRIIEQQWEVIAGNVMHELEEYQMPDWQHKRATLESVAAALEVTHSMINLMEMQMQPLLVKLGQLVKMNSEFEMVDDIRWLIMYS